MIMKKYKIDLDHEVELELKDEIFLPRLLEYLKLKCEVIEIDSSKTRMLEESLLNDIFFSVTDFKNKQQFNDDYFHNYSSKHFNSEAELIEILKKFTEEVRRQCHLYPLTWFGKNFSPKIIDDSSLDEFKKFKTIILFNEEIPIEERLILLTLGQLKGLLKKNDLRLSGTKHELILRLKELDQIKGELNDILKGVSCIAINKQILSLEECNIIIEYQLYSKSKLDFILDQIIDHSPETIFANLEPEELFRIRLINELLGRSYKKKNNSELNGLLKLSESTFIFFDETYNEIALVSNEPLIDVKNILGEFIPVDDITYEISLHCDGIYILAFSLVNFHSTN